MKEKDVTFRFKQFSVRQDRCAMKVGTDGVLLGALASLYSQESRVKSQESRVLDIGTGTGVVALMLAQRYPEARMVGVEIDPEAAAQAAENFAASPWGERLAVRQANVNENENGHTPPSQATPPLTEGEELGNLLLFNADGSATEEYRALTGEFYL